MRHTESFHIHQKSQVRIFKQSCNQNTLHKRICKDNFLQFEECYSSHSQRPHRKERCPEAVSWRSGKAGECTDTHQYINSKCTDRLRKHWTGTTKKKQTESAICIILHINYILSIKSWISTKSRHHNNTHSEERSLVKKDAFRAKSSINFKSSSSIMSSGRASSSSSRFSAILQDDVTRLRSRMYIQTWKLNPAYLWDHFILYFNLELINLHACILCYPRKLSLCCEIW